MTTIREEAAADLAAREILLDAAFGQERFRKTSERLREGRLPAFALVADGRCRPPRRHGTHVERRLPARAAAPCCSAPWPSTRRIAAQGIGGRLMRAALGRAAMLGEKAVLLVGDAPYYGRFGFAAALTERLWLPGPVARERFLGLELREGALHGAAGLVSPTGERLPAPSIAELVAELETGERTIFAEAA